MYCYRVHLELFNICRYFWIWNICWSSSPWGEGPPRHSSRRSAAYLSSIAFIAHKIASGGCFWLNSRFRLTRKINPASAHTQLCQVCLFRLRWQFVLFFFMICWSGVTGREKNCLFSKFYTLHKRFWVSLRPTHINE